MGKVDVPSYQAKLAVMLGSVVTFFDADPKVAAMVLKHLFDKEAFKLYYKQVIKEKKNIKTQLSAEDTKVIDIIHNNLKTIFVLMHGSAHEVMELLDIKSAPEEVANMVARYTSAMVSKLISELEDLSSDS